jgi:hypothetical protein
MPYRQRRLPGPGRQKEYRFAAGLWVGPLRAGKTKEFIFHIKIAQKGSYQLVCIVDALAKWGVKEQPLIVNIE